MRIALVITELETGGAENCLTELAIFLAARGCEVRVLALGPLPPPPRDELKKRLEAAGVDVRFGQARGVAQLGKVLHWLRRELRDFAPDLVQSMLWHANVTASLALRGQPVKLVGGLRVSEPRRWRWPIERLCSGRMSMLVCVSEDVRRHAQDHERLPGEKLVIIPNGISQDALGPYAAPNWSELGVAAPEHVLLFVGRLEPQKGALQLAEHLPEMLACLPAWQAVIVGSGGQQHRMRAVIKRSGLTEKVHFAGWQPRPARWMLASDLLLHPAAYEGMPNVLLEAMAVGKPFVAFAVDGVRQLLADDYPEDLANTQLADPRDWSEFNRCVRRLANDAGLRRACGEANRHHVLAHFRLEDQLAKYEALYRALIQQPAVELSSHRVD